MIITGDIAQPYVSASSSMIPSSLQAKCWLGNLEGSLIGVRGKKGEISGVYNDLEAIDALCIHIPYKAFSIANNHLLDAADVKTTLSNIQCLGVGVVGGGSCLEDAQRPLLLKDNDGTKYCVLSFGWANIQCVPAAENSQGVNPYMKENVLHCVELALKNVEPVICFFHWDYELEAYPQPYDRQLAMDLIDLGVAAVIGCHAHRTQPIEFYRGKPIVYGLGNFLFCQGHYMGGSLRFPRFCEDEYAFEVTKDGYNLHCFHYDQKENKLVFVRSVTVGPDMEFQGKAEFSGMSASEYEMWFKRHRVQKKLLPVFKSHETKAGYWLKSKWIRMRGTMISLLSKLHLKSADRAER